MSNEPKDVRAPATSGGRRPSGVAGARGDQGRWSSTRKSEIVLRILRGEDLDALSRELKVTPARLAQWRDEFLMGGQANLKSREADTREDESTRLRAKVGELTMENELLRDKIAKLESDIRPPLRRLRP